MFNVPKNHKFKGFMMTESGHYERGNYVLINESGKIKAVHKSKIQESFWNPGKFFQLLQDEVEIDAEKWNNAKSQEERDAMVRPQLEEFWKKHKDEMSDADVFDLFEDMEDSNYHTEYRILSEIIKKEYKNEN